MSSDLDRNESVVLGLPWVPKTPGDQFGHRRRAERRRCLTAPWTIWLPRWKRQAAGQLTGRLPIWTHPSMLAVDETDYLPIQSCCTTVNWSISAA